MVPFWLNTLQPLVKEGKRLLVVAHGNSLRALIKHIDGFSNEDIVSLNLPTGVPLVYQFDAAFKPVPQAGRMDGLSGRYVGDLEAIAAEINKVKNRACRRAAARGGRARSRRLGEEEGGRTLSPACPHTLPPNSSSSSPPPPAEAKAKK